MGEFQRDASHWLYKLSPDEWIRAAMQELRRAEEAYKQRNVKAGIASAKRAAGMALNGALICQPNEAWGRSFVDHVSALAKDEGAPQAVREACRLLLETHAPGGEVISLRGPRTDERVLDAARDVMAHAYFVVKKHESA